MASQKTIICVGCNQPKGTTNEQYEKLLGLGKIENYLCRSCRPKKTKPAKEVVKVEESDTVVDDIPVESIDGVETIEEDTYKLQLPEWMRNYTPAQPRANYSKDEYRTINTCFRPDIFYGNQKKNNDDGSCDGCHMFEYCGCLTKALKK